MSLLLAVLLTFAPSAWGEERETTKPIYPVGHIEGFELVWQDEFDGEQLDESKWNYRRVGRVHGEAVLDRSCVSLDGKGTLSLTTRWDANTQTYRVGMIGTKRKFERAYGYYEARIQFEKESGHHGAFWLQSPRLGKFRGDTHRSGTEIDIVEYFGWKNSLSINLHWDGYQEGIHQHVGKKVQIPSGAKASDGFHVYGLLWNEDEYIFYIDGKEVWRTNQAVSGVRQYVILSLLISDYERQRADAARDVGKFPDAMQVDYVRVFRQLNPRKLPKASQK